MKNKKIKTFLMAAGILSCATLAAQNRHEFSISAGGGISTLLYEASPGLQKNGLGGNVGLNYHYFFTNEWGIGTGLEFAYYNTKYKADLMFKYNTTDNAGNNFEFNSKIDNYSETQNAMMLQIPLMLQYQVGKMNRFYLAFGGKFGIPLSERYKSLGTVQNSGSYQSPVQEVKDLGTFNINEKGKFGIKAAVFASIELGAKWVLGEKTTLYTGAYLDYGLNNIYSKPKVNVPLVEYNVENPTDLTMHSVLNSQYPQSVSNAFVDKIHPLSAGLKLRLSFGFGSAIKDRKSKQAAENSKAEAQRIAEEKAQQEAVEKAAAEKVAAEKAEVERLAKEKQAQEAARIAAENARREEARKQGEKMQAAKTAIQQPVDYYQISKTELTDRQKQQLDEKIALLKQYPYLEVFIYGHTCDIGSKAINEKIGLLRAENAKKYLISQGIEKERIIGIASKRDTEPIVPNINEENRRQNRRVEIVIVSE